MKNTLSFSYSAAALVAILGGILVAAVSFGLHLTQDNITTTTRLAGIVLGTIAAGGGTKEAALIHGGFTLPSWLRFSAASLVAGVGAAVSLAVSYGLHLTQQNIESVETLVGLIAAGLVVGGAQVTSAAVRKGVHPKLAR